MKPLLICLAITAVLLSGCTKAPAITGSWRTTTTPETLYYIREMVCIQPPGQEQWLCNNYTHDGDETMQIGFPEPETWTLDFKSNNSLTVTATTTDSTYTINLQRIAQ